MWFSSWLRNSQRSDSTPTLARKRASFRPQLEALESRWLLSTLTVLNNLDSGAGSLRAEIAVANSNDTIVFAPTLNGKTITLTSGELDLTKNLTIQGPGASQLTVSGGNASRVFDARGINNNEVLSGLTITQGNAKTGAFPGEGGGILNTYYNTLTISNCVLSNNQAANEGGGIANTVGGTLIMVNSTLSGNRASNGEGGGVFSNSGSTVTMQNCTLTGNSAAKAGGGVWTGGSTTTIYDCTLSNNTEAYLNGTQGDAIYSAGGSGSVTVTDSIFSEAGPILVSPIVGPWINGGGNTGVK